MTEKEAKTKWCPMVRYGRDGCNVAVSLTRAGREAAMCIGSACMMWRWAIEEAPPPWAEPEKLYVPVKVQSETRGQCGLVRELT